MQHFNAFAAISLSLAGCSTAAFAQAFGVTMGDPVSNYSGAEVSDGVYLIAVPRPNSEFESYAATSTPETGICRVIGIGKDYQNDNYGHKLRSAFKSLHGALKERYGTSYDVDFLHAGSIWNEPNEFGWSLYQNERSLNSFWDEEEGSAMPPHLDGIVLSGKATDPSTTYLNLSYQFSNFGRCQEIIDAKDNEGL